MCSTHQEIMLEIVIKLLEAISKRDDCIGIKSSHRRFKANFASQKDAN